MIIISGLGECERCGISAGKRFLTRTKKSVCIKCMRIYDPPRMTLGVVNESSHMWNFEANKYEDVADIEWLEQCGWFTRSRQEILYKLLPRVRAIIYHMEFSRSEHRRPSMKCLRCLDYPFFEDGMNECGVEACRKFCNSKEPPKFKFPTRRSRFIL